MIRKLLVTSIAAGIAAASTGASAQSGAGAQVIEEIEVISSTRRSEGLADLNAAVSVIGLEELSLLQHTHYQEALNRLPGVNINRNNGQESLASIRSPVLTGSGACGAFLVAENGIPLRSSGFCNVNEMFDAHSEVAQRIEVVRGPGSAFWGSNAVHGLINVVLPEPGEAGNIRLESGPRGSYRAKGSIGTDNGKFKQTLYLSGVDEQGFRADSHVHQQKASWLYNYTTPDGTELDGGFTFSNLNQETAGYVTGTDAYADDFLRRSNPNPEAYRDSASTRVWTSITQEVDDWEIVITPYWREVNMNFIQHFLPGLPIEDFEHRSLGVQTAGYHSLPNGAELALGIDLEDTNGALKQFQTNPTEGSFFLRSTIPQGRHYDYEVDARQIAGFINYEQSYDTGWDLSLGLRLESIKYHYDNLMIDGRTDEFGVPCNLGGCRYNRPADRSDGFTNLSPKLGLSYALNENNKLQFRVQRGFRAPQATELYRLQNNQSVADLDSVELDSFEIAMTGAGDGWDYSVSLYHMDKENEIITDSSRINLNGSHTQHRGLELVIGHDITETISIRAVANMAKHTYENSPDAGATDITGNDVDTAPNIFGNVRLSWQPSENVSTELEWVNMGEYFTNPENTARYGGHDLFNARARVGVNDDLTLSVNVMNILDEKYAERADWTTFNGDRYFPGENARVFVALDWNFR